MGVYWKVFIKKSTFSIDGKYAKIFEFAKEPISIINIVLPFSVVKFDKSLRE